jgi:hypothetical protein
MKAIFLSCGHNIHLDDVYEDYEGQMKYFACNAMIDVKIKEGNVKNVKYNNHAKAHDYQRPEL